jgi:hypothetical protein
VTEPPITERTKVGTNLKGFIGLAAAILGGGFVAGQQIATVGWRMSALESRLGDLPSKGDLRAVESAVQAAVGRQLQGALVRCPPTVRGSNAWVQCRILFGQDGGR